MNEVKVEEFVVSSRLRFARNIRGIKFNADSESLAKVAFSVMDALEGEGDFQLVRLNSLDEITMGSMLEQHLISPALIEKSDTALLALGYDNAVSIMIGEEDLIRSQAIVSGYNLRDAYELNLDVDKRLGRALDFCYDQRLGYLTACPTNIGTAMRASVMMFLPALTKLNEIHKIINAYSAKNITVRGVYGEGSASWGYLFQVSNQKSLGISEEDILSLVSAVTSALINAEHRARQLLMSKNQIKLTDLIMRAYGSLKNSYVMECSEFMELIALVKLGKYYGIFDKFKISDLDKLIISVQPNSLQKMRGKVLDAVGRDMARSDYIRKMLG